MAKGMRSECEPDLQPPFALEAPAQLSADEALQIKSGGAKELS